MAAPSSFWRSLRAYKPYSLGACIVVSPFFTHCDSIPTSKQGAKRSVGLAFFVKSCSARVKRGSLVEVIFLALIALTVEDNSELLWEQAQAVMCAIDIVFWLGQVIVFERHQIQIATQKQCLWC